MLARIDAVFERIASWGDGPGRWLGLALVPALFFVALLGTSVVRLRVSEPLGSIVPEEGLAFAAKAVSAWPDGATNESTVDVLEDGHSLPFPHTYPPEIRSLGHGRFGHRARAILFSSSDGTDPRSNGRVYTVEYDPFPPWPLAGLLVVAAVLLNARRAARVALAIENAHPAKIGAVLALLALGYRLALALRNPEPTFGGHLVKGAPFSDASVWFTAAKAFSRHDGDAFVWGIYGARRPFYYALLGSFFALTGPSVLVARILNVVLSTATPVIIFDALRRMAPRSVALLGALVQAFLLLDAATDLSVMTEPLGNFLGAVSVWTFVQGAQLMRDPGRKRAALLFLAGGAALGLSNLARPLTLGAAMGMPVALVLVGWRARVPWRRIVLGGAVFGLGVALTVGPWLVRQRLVYGIWSLSHNTAEIWYAATSPDWGTWRPAVDDLAPTNIPLVERVAFYMERASRNIHEHPLWFARHLAEQFALAARVTQPASWVLVLACAWYAASSLAAAHTPRRGLSVLVALLGIVVFSLPDPPLYPVTLLALVLSVVARQPIALLGGFVAATFSSLAMLAMSCDRRLSHSIEWATAALGAWVVLEALSRLEKGSFEKRELGDRGSWGTAGRVVGLLAALVSVIALLGFVRVLATHPTHEEVVLPAEPWRERALDPEVRTILGPLADRLVVRRARVFPGSVIHVAAGETIRHWSSLFQEPRPYPFTVFTTDPDLPESYAVCPGDLRSPDGELVLVGLTVPWPNLGIGPVLELVAVLSPEGKRLFPEDRATALAQAQRLAKLR